MHKGFCALITAPFIAASRSISVADAKTKTYLNACITLAIFLDTSRSWMHLPSRFSIVPSVISTSIFVAYFFSVGKSPLPKVDEYPGCICPYFSDATTYLVETSVYLDVHVYLLSLWLFKICDFFASL